jgi:membrane associated rhomboid family serine protease
VVAGIEPDPRLIEIFFSKRLTDCEQQTLTLSAVGIHSWTVERDGGFAVLVAEESFDLAYKHLSEVAREALPVQEPVPIPISHPNAWLGSVLYAIVLMGVAYAAGIDLFGADWLAAGALNGTTPSTHEWWRVITALTLHTDVAHLVGNLVFGIVLGYFLSLAVGGGVAWAGILLGAAMGNSLDAFWMPESHSSIGASTSVFAALGLLSAYAWRRESATNLRRVKRWSPLVAGIMLLGLTGMGGEHTDIVAHVTGFASGCVLGAFLGKLKQDRFTKRAVQLAAASLSIAAILGAWAWVLLRA